MNKSENLSQKVLEINDYSPYLPVSDYLQPVPAHMDYQGSWKKHADETTTPRVIANLYKALYENGFIPDYSRQKPFVLISYGSNIPTHERLIFDLDRSKRQSRTHVIAVDHLPIPENILSQLLIDPNTPQKVSEGNIQSSFTFVRGKEEVKGLPPSSGDVIMSFRAGLYFSLIRLFYDPNKEYIQARGKILSDAKETLKKYFNELNENGCVVVDANSDKQQLNSNSMITSTADLIEKYRDSLEVEKYFTLHYVGKGESRVLVLKKKLKKTKH